MEIFNTLILYSTPEEFSIIDKKTQDIILGVHKSSIKHTLWLKQISKSEKLVAYTEGHYIFKESFLYIRDIFSGKTVDEVTIATNYSLNEFLFISDLVYIYTRTKDAHTKMYICNIKTKQKKLLQSFNNYFPHMLTYLENASLLFVQFSSYTKKYHKYILMDLDGNTIVENSFTDNIEDCTIINDYLVTINHKEKAIQIINMFTNTAIGDIDNIGFTIFHGKSPVFSGGEILMMAPYTEEYHVMFSSDYIIIRDENNNLKLINIFYFKKYIDFFLKNGADFFFTDSTNKSVYDYSNSVIQHYYKIDNLIRTNNINILNIILNSQIKEIDSKIILLLLKNNLNSILSHVLSKISNKQMTYKKTGEELNVLLIGLEKLNLSAIQVSIDNEVIYQEIIKNRNFLNLIRMERIDILKLFLKEYYYRNIIYNESLFILSKCINFNSLKTLKYLIENSYVKVSPALLDGNSLVHLIVCQNRYEAAKIIIPLFAKNDLKMTNKNGNTAMGIAIKNKDNDTIKLLSTYGIKIPLLYRLFKI